MDEQNRDLVKYGIVLIKKENDEGLTKEDILRLLEEIETDEVYPVEFTSFLYTNCAMGFISRSAAKEIDYQYQDESELYYFMSDTMTGKDETQICNFRGIKILILCQ